MYIKKKIKKRQKFTCQTSLERQKDLVIGTMIILEKILDIRERDNEIKQKQIELYNLYWLTLFTVLPAPKMPH